MIPYAPDFNENLSQCVPFFFFFHFNKLVFFTDSESQKDKDIFFKDTYLVATGLSCSTWKLLLWHVGSSSLTRNQTQASPTLETHSFSHWATRQVLEPLLQICVKPTKLSLCRKEKRERENVEKNLVWEVWRRRDRTSPLCLSSSRFWQSIQSHSDALHVKVTQS